MIKKLTKIGNSKAIILPASMIRRFKIKKVTIEATEAGILIRPVETKTPFKKKMELARRNKVAIYRQMEKEANEPQTIAFYNNPENTSENMDLEILES